MTEHTTEYELLQDALLLEELEILESSTTPLLGGDGEIAMTMRLQVDEELLPSCAFGLLFILGVLSFHDGRPRGISGEWYEDDDQFTLHDLLRAVRFEAGTLRMHLDYLRGRCLKTDITIAKDGAVTVNTTHRGESAARWVNRIRGKKFLRPV